MFLIVVCLLTVLQYHKIVASKLLAADVSLPHDIFDEHFHDFMSIYEVLLAPLS